MKSKKKAITGASPLMLLVVICFAAVMVSAALVWDSIFTDSKNPQIVHLIETDNEWDEITDFYAVDQQYNVTMTALYGGSAPSTYYITVTESSTGTKYSGDFTITMKVGSADPVALTEYSTGVWGSGALTATPDTSETIIVTIEPENGSLDLSGVSWTISTGDTNPYVPL